MGQTRLCGLKRQWLHYSVSQKVWMTRFWRLCYGSGVFYLYTLRVLSCIKTLVELAGCVSEKAYDCAFGSSETFFSGLNRSVIAIPTSLESLPTPNTLDASGERGRPRPPPRKPPLLPTLAVQLDAEPTERSRGYPLLKSSSSTSIELSESLDSGRAAICLLSEHVRMRTNYDKLTDNIV